MYGTSIFYIYSYSLFNIKQEQGFMFRIIPEGLYYKEHVFLKNGRGILFKPATNEDIRSVKSFLERVSKESLRMRFMASVSFVSDIFISDLCSGDFKNSGCLLAYTGDTVNSKVVGLGNYISIGNGHTAEVAFLIDDSYQGKGIGTLLLERLAGIAVANGFLDFEAEVLSDNQSMINVFSSSGFEKHQVWNSDTVHIELPVSGAAPLWERAGLRDRIAVANSLKPLLCPKAVAVVGASRDSASIGNIIFQNICNADFHGKVYPINQQAEFVNGVKAYTSVSEVPEKIDLAVISVPAEKVFDVAVDVINAGVKGLVVVSAGFADAGQEGLERQKKLVELVRAHGVRLLGPSCLGVMNTEPSVKLNASLASKIMPPGHIGFFSHSAALGLVILEYAIEKGLGFTTFVSAGNRADVSGNDLLQYWEEDTNTKMAILYLETFGNPRRFVRIARRMTNKKPILCIKSGRSVAGRKTTEAKSGINIAGNQEVDALFQQTGIILAPTLEELFDVALVISNQPLPKGGRVSIIANSSGMATLFADACELNFLEINGPGVMDLGAFTSPDKYEDAVYKALSDEKVDSLLIGFACVGNCNTEPFEAAIRRGVKSVEEKTKIEKPVLLCLMGAAGIISLVDESGKKNNQRKFPAFRFPESAVSALGRIVRYVEFKNHPTGKLIWNKDVKAEKAREIILQSVKDISTTGSVIDLDENKCIDLLSAFGIDFIPQLIDAESQVKIKINSDPLFGPVIGINLPAGKSIVRITPLTESDMEEICSELGWESDSGVIKVLGRFSQMIEEIPWLWELETDVIIQNEPAVTGEIKISVKSGGAERPSY